MTLNELIEKISTLAPVELIEIGFYTITYRKNVIAVQGNLRDVDIQVEDLDSFKNRIDDSKSVYFEYEEFKNEIRICIALVAQ